MQELASLTDVLGPWIAVFMLAVARLSFVMFLLPGVGEQVIPIQMRTILLISLAAAFSTTGVMSAPPLEPFTGYFGVLLGELAIGLFLGVSLRLTIWMLTIAGSVIAQSIGLAQFLGVALEHEAQTLTANLLSMAGAAVLVSANFHVMAVASFLSLYGEIPVGAFGALDMEFFINSGFAAVGYALLLAWPFVAVNLLYNICLGFINKALPQLMVAFVGAPFMVGAGVFLLAVSIIGLLIVWKDRALQVIGWM